MLFRSEKNLYTTITIIIIIIWDMKIRTNCEKKEKKEKKTLRIEEHPTLDSRIQFMCYCVSRENEKGTKFVIIEAFSLSLGKRWENRVTHCMCTNPENGLPSIWMENAKKLVRKRILPHNGLKHLFYFLFLSFFYLSLLKKRRRKNRKHGSLL